jgi:enterochelin esterase-like enzyme
MLYNKNNMYRYLIATAFVFALILSLGIIFAPGSQNKEAKLRFEISFPDAVRAEAVTGRVFVIITRNGERDPRLQAGSWGRSVPFFGVDVEGMKPGETVVIDENILGYPLKSLKVIPADEYYVQGLLNIYTQFKRADSHVVWLHMDQWEGQQFNRSPGNLISEVKKVKLDPEAGYTVKLQLSKVIPPIEVPPDTKWVKRIKIQSKLLSEFWGHPIYIGATVLLPKGYEEHPDVHYPVHYIQGHFSLRAPNGFRSEPPENGDRWGSFGYEFYKNWISDDFPRMICVTFQHPCPYFDDSYAVDSVNVGPYGEAITTELIPYIEEHFRIISKPYARVLSGGSTGGWESLALQVFYPDIFGGAWVFYPDPIDFRRYILTNIYEDDNAFYPPGREWIIPERPWMRDITGQIEVTMRQISQLEAVLGSKGRSGQQLDIWQAVYGPVGEDGYPKPLWNKLTGEIDHEVAEYMKEHYDLRYYLEKNWATIGPKLVGKLFFYCGDMDNFYLNEAVYMMEEFLENTKNPYYAGSFEYGRPQKPHGWTPFGRTGELEKSMAKHIAKNAPKGEDTSSWRY